MSRQAWLSAAWLSAIWLVAGCGPAAPGRPPGSAAVHVAPEPSSSAAPAAVDTAPAGYIPMTVVYVTEEGDEQPHVVFHGAPGSYLLVRPETGPEMATAVSAALFFLSPQARKVAQECMDGHPTPESREPYDRWAKEKLANGGTFVRAEFSLRRGLKEGEIPDEGYGVMRLVARRGDKVEKVDPGDNAVPVILLQKLPLFVELKLLREIGGLN